MFDDNTAATSDDSKVPYTGLDPIVSPDPVAAVVFNLPNGDDTLTLSDLGGGMLRLDGATIEQTDFAAPLAGGSITINLGGGADSLTIASLTLNANTTLTVNGDAGTDSVIFGNTAAIGVTGNATFNVESVTNLENAAVTIDGSATFSGGANVTLGNQAGDTINLGSVILSSAGAVNFAPDNAASISGSASSLTLSPNADLTISSPITTTGGLTITGQQAVNINANLSAGGPVSILANQDATGSEGFTMASGTSITTTDDTANAVKIAVNSMLGGTGSATITSITTGTTAGTVSVDAVGGAIVDGNAATNNITSGNTVLSGLLGVGSPVDPIETTVSRLEGAGGTGGLFVINAGSLAIGGTIGLTTSTGDINVSTTSGSLTVEENVSSTSGSITLKVNDLAAAGNNLTVNGAVTVFSTLGNISLQAGDDVTLTAGSIINATAGSIAIDSDSDDADLGTGTTLTVAAQLISGSAAGTTITGGSDSDNYAISYPTGSTNTGTVTVEDAAGTDAVVVNGTAAAESFFFTTDVPTTATTEQVGRGGVSTEPIVLPTTIETLRINGAAGNDSFTVQPSIGIAVTSDGGSPVVGGVGVPPGDTLTLDTVGNSLVISGADLMVSGGYEAITPVSIESLPLVPTSASPIQRYDFNARTLNAAHTAFVQTATQAG